MGAHNKRAGGRPLPFLVMSLLAIFALSSPLNGNDGPRAAGPPEDLPQPQFEPHLGTSYYLFELNGMDIGTGTVSLQREGNFYRIRYEARTTRKVDRIYKTRYKGEGVMALNPLKPVCAELYQRIRSRSKDTTICFEENGRIITTETKRDKGERPSNKVRGTPNDGLFLDPLSAVFFIQGMDWSLGKERALKVFTGKARYETRFTCVGRKVLSSTGARRPSWVIRNVSRNLDRKEGEKKDKAPPVLTIYVSAEGYPDVLRVEATHAIGHVTLTLQRFEPAPVPVR
jgi:hypothetical protein